MSKKPWVDSYAVDRTGLFTSRTNTEHGWYEIGHATTKWGIVGIYREEEFWRIRAMRGRRCFDLHGETTLTDRGLATVCGRFAKRVSEGK